MAQRRFCLQCRRPGFDPLVWKIPGEGNSYLLQYSCLENSMDRGAWGANMFHGVPELDTIEQLTLSVSLPPINKTRGGIFY